MPEIGKAVKYGSKDMLVIGTHGNETVDLVEVVRVIDPVGEKHITIINSSIDLTKEPESDQAGVRVIDRRPQIAPPEEEVSVIPEDSEEEEEEEEEESPSGGVITVEGTDEPPEEVDEEPLLVDDIEVEEGEGEVVEESVMTRPEVVREEAEEVEEDLGTESTPGDVSKSMRASEAINWINTHDQVDQIDAFVAGETRSTITRAAQQRISDLKTDPNLF